MLQYCAYLACSFAHACSAHCWLLSRVDISRRSYGNRSTCIPTSRQDTPRCVDAK
ncbi:hypothetical protein PF008_g1619 [Phytophthora fragariae]|uniref:Uncharacterized protein n=1 Tax=Phytophthora fragariae TaxID=53985 RepID=A0A6G0SK61_9STRA|nr:hypothetical protein PF008_g1619 [Phytophthora fragariae]